jgi:hypothetical protein
MLSPEKKLHLIRKITEAVPKAVRKAVSLFAEELGGEIPEGEEAQRLVLIRLVLESPEAAAVLHDLMPDTTELEKLRDALAAAEDRKNAQN